MRKILNRSTVDDIIRDIDDLDSDTDSSITQFNPTCWSISKGDEFAPSFSTIPKVPAGLYEIGWNPSLSAHVLKKLPVNTDELYELPSDEIKNILEDIEQFWTRREIYRQYNFTTFAVSMSIFFQVLYQRSLDIYVYDFYLSTHQ